MKKKIKGIYNFQLKNSGYLTEREGFLGQNVYEVEIENNDAYNFPIKTEKKYILRIYYFGYSIIIEEIIPSYSNFLKKRDYINLPSTNIETDPRKIREIISDSKKLEDFSRKIVSYYSDTENTRAFFDMLSIEKVEKFLIDNADWVEWSAIHSNKYLEQLSIKLLEDFKDQIDWLYITSHLKLSFKALNQIKNFVDIKYLFYWQRLPESFIEEHMDKVDFIMILNNQNLSEEFIIKHMDIIEGHKIYWEIISEKMKLSHEFLVQFEDKLSWEKISKHQELSEKSLTVFWDKFDFELLKTNYLISGDLMIKFEISNERKRALEEIQSKSILGWIKKKVKDILYYRTIKKKNGN